MTDSASKYLEAWLQSIRIVYQVLSTIWFIISLSF